MQHLNIIYYHYVSIIYYNVTPHILSHVKSVSVKLQQSYATFVFYFFITV